MLLRIRASSFLAGFGLASGAAFWQLRGDIVKSSEYLAAQVGVCGRADGGWPERCDLARGRRCASAALRPGLQTRSPPEPAPRRTPSPFDTTHPQPRTQAQEARDSLDARVAALEAVVLKQAAPAAAAAAAVAAAAAADAVLDAAEQAAAAGRDE